MNKTDAINLILAELDTFYSKGSYGGPVVHYWKNSHPYAGFGIDWRYEGLIRSFISLHAKSRNLYFVQKIRECADFIVANMLPNGGFRNSGFENNPSFGRSFMPHEASVIIAILEAAKFLKKNKLEWEKYYSAAKQSVDRQLIPQFWNESQKAFMQYEASRGQTHNIFVPNKMATISEALFILSEMSGEKTYEKYGRLNLEKSISMADSDGVSLQSDANPKKIVFYNAREVRALGMYGFEEEAELKAEFIGKHWEDGFDFCEVNDKTARFPVFVAGAGTILGALAQTAGVSKKQDQYILENIRKNGSIRSFSGLAAKDTFAQECKDSTQDAFSVPGWIDKTLQYLSETVDDYEYEQKEAEDISVPCADGIYTENAHAISARGKTYSKKYDFAALGPDTLFGSREGILPRAAYSIYRKASTWL